MTHLILLVGIAAIVEIVGILRIVYLLGDILAELKKSNGVKS